MPDNPLRRPVALVLTVVLLAACADAPRGDGSDAGGPTVVVTTSILGDVVSGLVGDDGDVEVLMGRGVDPHAFSPSAAQAAAVRDADLVVANGLGLEESLEDLLDAAAEDGATVFELAPELDPLPFGGDEHGDDDHGDEEQVEDGPAGEDGHDGTGLDPHVWFDPVRMADGVVLLAQRLADVDGTLADEEWERRGAEAAAELLALDEELRGILAGIPAQRRTLVTNHDAIGYLAARYDLDVVGTVIPGGGTLASAGADRIAALADLVAATDVPAIFAENTTDDRLAAALAREVGRDVEVVTLYTDALGEAGSGADTYEGLLRTDARLIAEALG